MSNTEKLQASLHIHADLPWMLMQDSMLVRVQTAKEEVKHLKAFDYGMSSLRRRLTPETAACKLTLQNPLALRHACCWLAGAACYNPPQICSA